MTRDNRDSRFESRFESNRLENRVDEPELEGSTRLGDRPRGPFQQRRELRRQREQRREEQREQFAGALDIDASFVEPRQLDDRGEEIGFVPDDSGRDELAAGFADERPFVEPADALVDADPRDGVATRVDPERSDQIADRAREETAADADLIEPADLDAEVGAGGVEDVRTRPDRRDDIAERAAAEFADDDPFAEPADFGVEVGAEGIEDAGLTDTGARRRAGREFAAETPLDEVGADDVRELDDGFGLREGPQRELAAMQFEEDTRLDTVDPDDDIREVDDGFGLASDAEQEIAARQFEDELDAFGRGELDPGPDIRQVDDGFGLGEQPQRELAAGEFEAATPLEEVDPMSDIRAGSDGFELRSDAQRRGAARQFEAELDQFGPGELDPTDDVRDIDNGFGLAEDPARQVAADQLDQEVDYDVDPADIDLEPVDGGAFEGVFDPGGSR